MSTRLSAGGSYRCELCYHWSPTEESDSFIVIENGTERKVIHGICGLKTSQPDSECSCTSWERNIEVVEDQTVKMFTKVIHDAQDALVHFKTTGDRSKFKEWLDKYKGLKLGGEK